MEYAGLKVEKRGFGQRVSVILPSATVERAGGRVRSIGAISTGGGSEILASIADPVRLAMNRSVIPPRMINPSKEWCEFKGKFERFIQNSPNQSELGDGVLYSVLEGCVPEAVQMEIQTARDDNVGFYQFWNTLDARYAIYQASNVRERMDECGFKTSKINSDEWREFYTKFTKCLKLLPEMTEGEAYVKLMEKAPEWVRRKICEREIKADQKEPAAKLLSSVDFSARGVLDFVEDNAEVRAVSVEKLKAGEYRVIFANEKDRTKGISVLENTVVQGAEGGGYIWSCGESG